METSRGLLLGMSVVGGRAENICSYRGFRILTQGGRVRHALASPYARSNVACCAEETQRKGSRVYQCYDDILSRIAEEPVWFDEHAVSRYCKFAPDNLANIYAGEAALAEVTCQVCKRLFRVAFSTANWRSGTIADAIRSRTLHFGEIGRAHV